MAYGRKGYGFAGSNKIETTSENMQEIVDMKMTEQTAMNIDGYYKFYFDNKNDCIIYINGSEYGILLEAGDGFETDEHDAKITSLIVEESGTNYKWFGHY